MELDNLSERQKRQIIEVMSKDYAKLDILSRIFHTEFMYSYGHSEFQILDIEEINKFIKKYDELLKEANNIIFTIDNLRDAAEGIIFHLRD